MPAYHDLHLQRPELVARAKALGWATAQTAVVVDVRNLKDIPRQSEALVIAEGANTELLRQACRRSSVSLINAYRVPQFHRDDGLIRAVADGKKAFEIPIFDLLHAQHVYRTRWLVQTRALLARCIKLKAGYVFTSRAKEQWDVKSPREVIAIGQTLGLTREQADYSISARAEQLQRQHKEG